MEIAQAIRLGAENYGAGRLAEAEQIFKHILAADPGNPHASHALGLIALAAGRFDMAIGLIQKAMANLPLEPAFYNSLGEVHRVMGRFEDAIASYDRALELDANGADALSNKGIALQELGRHDDALACYERALKLRPVFPAALNNRGVLLNYAGHLEEALDSFERALAAAPALVDARINRAGVLCELGRLDEALADCDLALAAHPSSSKAFDARGAVLQRLLRIDEALESHGKALALNPGSPHAGLHQSIALLMKGDYAEGFRAFEHRKQAEPALERNFAQPEWTGKQPLAGKTILVHAEQGLGDTIQYLRYVPLLAAKGARVVLEVQPQLKPILRGMTGAAAIVAQGGALPKFDFRCPLPSLPLAFGTKLGNIPLRTPYVPTDKQAVAAWKRKLARRGTRLVGLCWKSDEVGRRDRSRGVELSDLVPLFDLPGVRFVSLQNVLSQEELDLVAKRNNFGHPGTDFKDTAEAIAALDLVITVDTEWAHWAGALGKPVWVLLPHYPHWRWMLERQDSPWYPTARLFRQPAPGEWGPALQKVKRGLAAFGRPTPPSRQRA